MENKSHTFALVITGAVTSGKTTLALALGKRMGVSVLREGNGRDYFSIIEEIDGKRFPYAIFEHCSLLGVWEKFKEQYSRVVIVVLKLRESLLRQHYEKRLKAGSVGDFSKIDPILQQKEMLMDFQEMQDHVERDGCRCLMLDVNDDADYSRIEELLAREVERAKVDPEIAEEVKGISK